MKKALLLFLMAAAVQAQSQTPLTLKRAGINPRSLAYIDSVVVQNMARHNMPGAVVLVSRRNHIVYRKAFGHSQVVPEVRPMRINMMFDMASVTKPVATATSIMILCERGQLRLTDRVSDYVANFRRFKNPDSTWAEEARIWHLLTHTSGLPAYTNADSAAARLGRTCSSTALVEYIGNLAKTDPPGAVYRYSCLGFITLAHIIEKVSGKNVHLFSHENIFKPLQMRNTTFVPHGALLPLCVPTEVVYGRPWIGVVHDPLARLQAGISGNAGLFSTADNLARYCQMMLNGGILDGVRILSPITVNRMIHIPKTEAEAKRGYGWVVKDGQSWVGGDLLPDLGYGHTGYTGTSIWLDHITQTFVIILTNRVHPVDDGETDSLRSSVANIVAGAITDL